MASVDEFENLKANLVHLARLAVLDKPDDVRLFLARLVRKYRTEDPALAEQFDSVLRTNPTRTGAPLRKMKLVEDSGGAQVVPFDEESRLSLLKKFDEPVSAPLLRQDIFDVFDQLIKERHNIDRLTSLGLCPTRSAVFLGEPGVGKTLTARWLASQLGLPLYVLDLTAVMSSLLGRTGTNLRSVIEFAKNRRCVLLLDEFDSIAKRRNDDADVGELKRLVTVMLQEVDSWPPSGLLLAATNHPELIDPALWRRFDLVIKFSLPDHQAIKEGIQRFLGPDLPLFSKWMDVLVYAFEGESFSDIERSLQRFRRTLALGIASPPALIQDFISFKCSSLGRTERIKIAALLAKHTDISQHNISGLTGVSRDTIRKHVTQTKEGSE